MKVYWLAGRWVAMLAGHLDDLTVEKWASVKADPTAERKVYLRVDLLVNFQMNIPVKM